MHFLREKWASARLTRHGLIFAVTAGVLALIYFWHLGQIGYSPTELSEATAAGNLHGITQNSVNAPHNVVLYIFMRLFGHHFSHHEAFILRSVSVIFSLVFTLCFYKILKHWFGSFCAWLGAALFAATPFVILASRNVSGTIMILWPLMVIAAYMKWVRGKDYIHARFLLLTVLAALAVYEPGGLIFLLVGAFMIRGTLKAYLSKQTKLRLSAITIMFIILLVPFILTVVREPHLLKSFCLLPQYRPGIVYSLKAFVWSIVSYFWNSQNHNEFQIGRLAVLNAAQIILLVFGLYAMWGRARPKIYSLLGIFIVACLAAAINTDYNLLLLGLPAVGLIVTAGLRYLHLEWTTVFPRNPLPRGLALVVMLAVIVIHVAWGAHYALTAWPHSLAAIKK